MKKPIVAGIALIGRNRELGKDNKLIWKIPDDLKRLKSLTVGHPVIMGRKTFDSVIAYLGKPLPERPNIVVTRKGPSFLDQKGRSFEDTLIVGSLEEAIEAARKMDEEEVFIIGGAQIFEAALPQTDKLYLTLVDGEAEADSFCPPYETEFTKKVFEEEREWNGLKYRWVDLRRE